MNKINTELLKGFLFSEEIHDRGIFAIKSTVDPDLMIREVTNLAKLLVL